MLQSFLPLFMMTFFICLFIVLMQFLWRYIDDLVGKGLTVDVIAELFFYAALTMVPMALPLAILLASLMTFGNLGERFELTAMKASGVSLFKTMRPLIVLMTFVAIGAFFFQNNVLPIAQTKMWTLLYSMRQKSPEVEIPEGTFYDQIPGVNLYVEHKDPNTGMLYDVMIYEVSKGFDNARIILADSGKLSFTENKTHLFLQLYKGEQFEQLQNQSAISSSGKNKTVPYRRESFSEKEIRVAFDANFSRMDESTMQKQYVGKNISQLLETIDTINQKVDSMGGVYAKDIKEAPYFGIPYYKKKYVNHKLTDVPQEQVMLKDTLNLDTLMMAKGNSYARTYITQALNKAKRHKQDYEFKSLSMKDQRKSIRRHDIEMQKKFTLSFACIIFFFIGAPLGAIIKKGGIGTPLVISVILFIIYYIIDNTGYKMARDGRLEVWMGMWISSAVLLPLGIFFTYKAMHDSALFNLDAYRNFFRKVFNIKDSRHYELKEVIIDEVDVFGAIEKAYLLQYKCEQLMEQFSRMSYKRFWNNGINNELIDEVISEQESLITNLTNSREILMINKISQYPIIDSYKIFALTKNKRVAKWLEIIFPIGIPIFLLAIKLQNDLSSKIKIVMKVNREVIDLLENKESNTIINNTFS
ncbi:MAG: LptF/LptG family permease [Muribaculaceae bacterium]|nr:LptF/LptG family permease [Muribaculaceae bacterium]